MKIYWGPHIQCLLLTHTSPVCVAESGSGEVTPLIEGPSDTSEMYTGNLFKSTHLQENIVESTGPVLSFSLQVPQAAIKSGEPVTQPGE